MNETTPVPDIHLEKAEDAIAPTAPQLSPPALAVAAVPATMPPRLESVTRPRGGLVNAVAIVGFVAAGLGIPVGVLLLVVAGNLHAVRVILPFGGSVGLIVALLRTLAVIEFVCDGLLILASVGLLIRKPWARWLMLGVAFLMVASGIASLFHIHATTIVGASIHLVFGLFALVVLLLPRSAAEFRPTPVVVDAPKKEEAVKAMPETSPVPAASESSSRRQFAHWSVLLLIATHVVCVLVGLAAWPAVQSLERIGSYDSRFVTQDGQITLSGGEPYTIYYAQPYASEPNLTVQLVADHFGRTQGRFTVREQSAKSFVVVGAEGNVAIRWVAKGRPGQ